MTAARFAVRLSTAAAGDIEAIHRYLVEHDAHAAADQLIDGLINRCAALSEFPERGAIPKELERVGIASHRQLVHGHYRIIYRVVENAVVIVLVCDGRRDLQSVLEQRLLRP